MLNITGDKLGKKFNREWIFRNLSVEIKSGDKLVILGGNGSGKSTLLQVLSGFITPNEGRLNFTWSSPSKEKEPTVDIIKNYLSFASPYIQLVEDFTAPELIDHISLFKPFTGKKKPDEILEICDLTAARGKFIKQYSSGMKQRLKLGLAILADAPVLLLDEPLSNLDKKAIQWYSQMIKDFTVNKTVIVCSNAIQEEFSFCEKELNVMNYKK